MQKTRGLLVLGLVALLCSASSCRAGEDRSAGNEGRVSLRVEDAEGRLVVLILNNSSDPLTINRLMRPVGLDPELLFYIDGSPAKFVSRPGLGHVSPQDTSDPAFVLHPDQIYGTSLRDSDMMGLFGIAKGQCRNIRVAYKNKLDVPEISDVELTSREVKYCN
nr:hypothetical protein [uncultured Pseudoxanthomonas sp.]